MSTVRCQLYEGKWVVQFTRDIVLIWVDLDRCTQKAPEIEVCRLYHLLWLHLTIFLFRHDGVVITTPEPGKDEDENGRSRSGTPFSSKGKEKETNIPVQTHQGAPTHSGPSSYYRSHTAIMTRMLVGLSLSFVPLKNSLAHIPVSRLSALPPPTSPPPWTSYPSSWQNGTLPPNMGPIGYLPHHMYYPSPHYRPHTNEYPATESPPYLKGPPSSATDASSSTQASISRNSSVQPPNQITQQPTNIDPNLDDRSELTEAEVLAAVQAVLMQAEAKDQREREEKERQHREQQQQQQQGGMDSGDSPRHEDDEDDLSDRNGLDSMDSMGLDDVVDGLHGYGSSSLDRPEPMEHMLTEDGEPMLNPGLFVSEPSSSL